ncbi:MAG TPA: 2-C-methyl-D-erythritol 4-phosphate cytidylyltransferase [Planctomycetaceae bacterium]|nr:2-C-methyl-D-erythritol 4-phosphate cytidylyltransferase [Planctomycetaceae bacterium]HRF00180.1 2-C-methyl-D-erythritol 4-phosphate cytidylyltransferase [Pirellulaceae bacterium]
MPKFAVIVAAAGRSSRFGRPDEKKPFVMLAGRPVWQHSVERFRARADVGRIVMVVAEEDREMVEERFGPNLLFCNVELAIGGGERAESVARGLAAIDRSHDFVAVHDAARPCVSDQAIERCFDQAIRVGAAILATKVTSTVKRRAADGTIRETVDRSDLWLAQTPQVARREWLAEALAQIDPNASPTDEAGALERIGRPVAIVEDGPENLKLTTAADLRIAKALLGERKSGGLADLLGD